jgi:enoyl-[acyl-carrier-protein] reductase (NADH)
LDDVAEAIVYLASERARCITGVVVSVDGGTVAGKLTPRRR